MKFLTQKIQVFSLLLGKEEGLDNFEMTYFFDNSKKFILKIEYFERVTIICGILVEFGQLTGDGGRFQIKEILKNARISVIKVFYIIINN